MYISAPSSTSPESEAKEPDLSEDDSRRELTLKTRTDIKLKTILRVSSLDDMQHMNRKLDQSTYEENSSVRSALRKQIQPKDGKPFLAQYLAVIVAQNY